MKALSENNLSEFQFRTTRESDVPALTALWREVFGDSEEFISKYYAGVNSVTLSAWRGDELAGMLNMVYTFTCASADTDAAGDDGTENASAETNGGISADTNGGISPKAPLRRGAYVYAVCTAHRYRGIGIFRELMRRAEDIGAAEKLGFLFLIPADALLFGTYRRLGYTAELMSAYPRTVMRYTAENDAAERIASERPDAEPYDIEPFDGDYGQLWRFYLDAVRSYADMPLRPFGLFRLTLEEYAGDGRLRYLAGSGRRLGYAVMEKVTDGSGEERNYIKIYEMYCPEEPGYGILRYAKALCKPLGDFRPDYGGEPGIWLE